MSRLEDAKNRLETALKRLEAVSENSVPSTSAQTALDAATAENKKLRDANESVSTRLDDAISRLRHIVQD
ncbi:MAG: hypothetical protein ACJAU6_003340 [Alphaproteobacteria bacterium]|jgi:uncharacterized protein (UPF0147 family)